ncbi:MAG: MlaD family protein [Cytophagales bacterium]|nr:MlaD family protein [Bernardetiaceae bacterium]MDW8210943.1 MlaD family protein [Cytophagales bacterium]
MKLSGETKVGLLALIASVILYVGFNYLKGIDFFDPTTSYYVVYDRIDGLTVSNQVQINGMSVGRVSDIRILQERNNQLLVTIDVQNHIQLGKGTIAQLSDNGLLGGKKIDLIVANTAEKHQEGDTLIARREGGISEILTEKAPPVLKGLDSAFANLNRILKEYQGLSSQVRRLLSQSADAAEQVNGMVADNRQRIQQITAKTEQLITQLGETEQSIKPLMQKLNTFADSLNAMQLAAAVNNTSESIKKLQQVLKTIEQGQGTLGKLVATDSLHANLNRTLVHLDSLFIDLKARPKRYVHFSIFGKKDPATRK